MQITLAILKFNLLGLLRNFKSAGIMFVIPVVFMGVFALAFGGDNQSVQMKLGYYIDPVAIPVAPDFPMILKEIDAENDSLSIDITDYDSTEELETALSNGQISIAMKLLMPFEIKIIGQQEDLEYILARSVLTDIITQTLYQENTVSYDVLSSTDSSQSVYDVMVPGLIIYGLLILIPGIAQSFTTITEKKYIQRLAFSKAKSIHIIAGNIIYYLLLAVIQMLILYMTARLFGYQSSGSPLLAIIPGLFTALFVIGVGLLIGSFIKKTDAATNIGTIVSIVLGFFSGSFISGIGRVLEFNFAGRVWQINDLLPSKWGTLAMEKILANNLTLADITGELAVIFISGLVFVIVGIIIYQRKQLSAAS